MKKILLLFGLILYFTISFSQTPVAIDSVWHRLGVVLADTVGQVQLAESSVLFEGSPQILTGAGTVFKIWYTYVDGSGNPQVGYAESLEGVVWHRYTSNPVIAGHCRGSIVKNGSTYVYYGTNGFVGSVDQYTSSDGISWTLAHSAVITAGSAGQYNESGVFNSWVIIEGGTWKMLLDGLSTKYGFSIGLWTSSDGFTWSANANNPVLPSLSGAFFTKVGSTYWCWGHSSKNTAFLPTDGYRESSSDLIHWSPLPYNSTFPRVTADEGVDSVLGQTADLDLIEANGRTYLFYTATKNGNGGAGAVIKGAIYNSTIANLVTTNENATLRNTWYSVDSNVYYNGGNVGIGNVAPNFPLVVSPTGTNKGGTAEINSILSDPSTGVYTEGFNSYYHGVWGNADSTKTGMTWQAGPTTLSIVSTTTGSSPTPTVFGGFNSSNVGSKTFYVNGHLLVGNSVDPADGNFINSFGNPVSFGNITSGIINGTYFGTGFGAVTHNIAMFSTKPLGNGITTGDFNFVAMTQIPGATTMQNNVLIGQSVAAACSSCLFSNVIGELGWNAATTGSFMNVLGRTGFFQATDATHGNAVGDDAGRSIIHATYANFFGGGAGYTDGVVTTTDVSNVVAIGKMAQVTQANSGILGGLDAQSNALRWGIDMTAPSAYLHLPAGKATAGFSPFKLTSGTNLLTTEAGALEYNGTHFYFTATNAGTRFQLDQQGVSNYAHTIFTPTTGGTVSLVNNQYNIINPAGALLALTVNLPSSPANNDVVYIKYTQNITTVTYANGTVVDGITAPTAGGLTVLVFDSGTSSWY